LKKIVIVSGVRTPIGKFGGSLKSFSPSEMGALVISEAVKRANINPAQVDEVIVGEVGEIDEDGFIGRVAMLRAGIPKETVAYSVNRQCGSGLQAIANAAMAIQTGHADIIVACGTENMSKLPYYQFDTRWGAKMGDKNFKDGVLSILTWPIDHSHNGVSAENVARIYNVSREEQDAYAARSQALAVKAIKEGKFKDEILPVEIKGKRGSVTVFDTDEGPREDSTAESLSKLKPCFVKDGTVTAGNSSTLNDAAAAVVVMSEEKAKELGLTPLLEVVDFAVAGNDPSVFGYAPKLSSEKLAQRLNLDLTSVDMIEINEAFASQSVAVARDLKLEMDKVNIFGGGISLGHPLGATGVILAIKVMYELNRTDKNDAMVSMCIGGGQGFSMYFRKYVD